ncbi:MAG TPA: hypothetical protein VJY47_01505 [Candidatus Dojkabacteria bacterium]|nr:hypothetical protein [Candidatus Dojkabacteria bacterium]
MERYTTYKAMGFVEALIAIMIAGIASVVLMQIAANALKEAVQNERIDKMTEYAVEGANMVQGIVERDKAHIKDITSSMTEFCFIPYKEGNTFNFHREGMSKNYWSRSADELIVNSVIERDNQNLRNLPKVGEGLESDFFRIACIRQNSTPAKYLVVRIGVAHLPSKGDITTDKQLKDYFYRTTINL